MTKNQIDYQTYLENVRHNQAGEAEVFRHNRLAESQNEAALAIDREKAEVSARSAAASARSAEASYLNALTNARAQNLKEEQWRDPLGGGATLNALGGAEKFINMVGRFITLLN